MNVNDSDIVRGLMLSSSIDGGDGGDMGSIRFEETDSESEADVLLTNTCAIREGAERKVWTRLHQLRAASRGPSRGQGKRIVGVLGCMAERLKEDLLKDGVADLVVGPDAYRDVPGLVRNLLALQRAPPGSDVETRRRQAISVQLSADETYADITPVRHHASVDEHAAFVTIQRGCSNRCSFCIVPFTRGQERSRPLESIVDEVRRLHLESNIKEVTLLGQNVNSYHDRSDTAIASNPAAEYHMSNAGFRSRIRRPDAGYFFADLLEAVADIAPDQLRVRFTSPHPKDYPKQLLQLMSERPNICNQLHMPAQSGSTTVLQRMKRGYTREAYSRLVEDARTFAPDVGLSSDFIAGFCGETEEEHADTVSLLEQVRYDQAFMFAYSVRGKTYAARTMRDDVPSEVKSRRLQEIIDTFSRTLHQKNAEREVGRLRLVLVEGEVDKRKKNLRGIILWRGSTDKNKRVSFPIDRDGNDEESAECWSDQDVRPILDAVRTGADGFGGAATAAAAHSISNDLLGGRRNGRLRKGDYAVVEVTEAEGCRLNGRLLWRTDSIATFEETGLAGLDAESLRRAEQVRSVFQQSEEEVEPSELQEAAPFL